MGENRKKVNAILRKNAERIERAKLQSVACPNPICRTRIEPWWSYCAVCGLQIATLSFTDRPFGWPVKLSPKIIAACVGGGITSQQIQHVYSLIRAAVSLCGYDDAPSYSDPPFGCPPDEEASS